VVEPVVEVSVWPFDVSTSVNGSVVMATDDVFVAITVAVVVATLELAEAEARTEEAPALAVDPAVDEALAKAFLQ